MHVQTIEKVEVVVDVFGKEARYTVNTNHKVTNAVVDLIEDSVKEKRSFRGAKNIRQWSDDYSTEMLALQALGLRPEQTFYILQDLTKTSWPT